ncbi:MAG: hypothetical protein JRH01_15050 [Deltaproteobacteria bacterium]|nr:hypothetical protein [Deltaproteobacteria bacterium]MBW2394013.1 hypothetical protein [Deltaproteobacteria bacterium]
MDRSHLRLAFLIVGVGLLLVPVGSAADEAAIVEVYEDILLPDQDENAIFDTFKKLRPRVRLFSRGMLDGDFGSADVDWVRFEGRVSLPLPVSEKLVLSPTISGGGTSYDFDGNRGFLNAGQNPGSDPFDDLYNIQIRLGGRYLYDDDWAAVGAIWVSSQYEDGADFADAVRPGGSIGVSHQFFEGFTLIGGVGISEKFDGGVSVAPFIQGSWKVNDWLKVETEGLGLEATAKVSDSLRVSLFGGVNSTRYLLDDRNDGPGGVGEGWIRDRRLPVGVGVEWRITKRFRLHFDVGAMLDQELKVIDEDDDTFDDESLDSVAPFASVRFEARF